MKKSQIHVQVSADLRRRLEKHRRVLAEQTGSPVEHWTMSDVVRVLLMKGLGDENS